MKGGSEPLLTPPPVPSEPVDREEVSPTSPNQNGEGRKGGEQEPHFPSPFTGFLSKLHMQLHGYSPRVTPGTLG